jgi:hypothetical protein
MKTMLFEPHTGMVTGALHFYNSQKQDSGEGLYWKYESMLKSLDSDFYSVICASGPVYLIKREFFGQVHPASADDFERTLVVLKHGELAKYNSQAIAYEEVSEKASQEIGRKTRIITQGWYALQRNLVLLNPFTYGKVSFSLFSHKLIRWLLPLFSGLMLVSNLFLWQYPFMRIVLVIQILTYVLGFLEIKSQQKKAVSGLLQLPAYWTAMNWASAKAFVDFIKGKQYATWNTIRDEDETDMAKG